MARESITELVERMAQPVVQEAGLELVDVEYTKEGGRWYLRVFIDKPGGIGLEECGYISQKIDKMLDEIDPIPQAYVLEVSSPGIERPLKKLADYDRFTGSSANITTFVPLNGKKKFTGRIVGVRGDDVILDMEGTEIPIPLEKVASARLHVEF